jgi:hypothetical protein
MLPMGADYAGRRCRLIRIAIKKSRSHSPAQDQLLRAS